MDLYKKELQKILDDTSVAQATERSKAELEAGIAELSALLKGPLSNVERLWLIEDRQHLRKQLAALAAL